MEPNDPILLILDLDETLIYATEAPLGRGHDFLVGPYSVYRRPHLAEFLASCSACSRLAFWSTASDDYVRAVVGRIKRPGLRARVRITRRPGSVCADGRPPAARTSPDGESTVSPPGRPPAPGPRIG
jgi:hypothetical protein